MLSQAGFGALMIAPPPIGRGPSAIVSSRLSSAAAAPVGGEPGLGFGSAVPADPGVMDEVEVNGQVEVQPDDMAQTSLSLGASTR